MEDVVYDKVCSSESEFEWITTIILINIVLSQIIIVYIAVTLSKWKIYTYRNAIQENQ